jgi:hypothetical protein
MHLESRCLQVLAIISDLDELPADHEPTTEELWDALRDIEAILNGEP